MLDTEAELVADCVEAPVCESVDADDAVLVKLTVCDGDTVCVEDADDVADMELLAVAEDVVVVAAVLVLKDDAEFVLVTAGETVLVIDADALDDDDADGLVDALDVDAGVTDTETCPVRLLLRSVPAQMEEG